MRFGRPCSNPNEHWQVLDFSLFDIKKRAIFVYNLMRSSFDDVKVRCDLQRMEIVLPYLLLLTDFYNKRFKVDLNSQYYINKVGDEPLDVSLLMDFLSKLIGNSFGEFTIFHCFLYFILIN